MLKRISVALCPSLQKAIETDPLLLDSSGFQSINRIVPELLARNVLFYVATSSENLQRHFATGGIREKPMDDSLPGTLGDVFRDAFRNYRVKIGNPKHLGRAELVINFVRKDGADTLQFIVRFYRKNVARTHWVLSGSCTRVGVFGPSEVIGDES